MPTRTELIWEGKYDAQGKRVAPLRIPLPFQTVETVNEAAAERRTLFSALEREKPWRNRLIWGDKKYVLPSLLPEFAGKVNLIYIDPPFDTGADFSFTASLPDAPDEDDGQAITFTKQPSVIEQKAYRDTWGRGIDSYLQWFYETVTILHELLAENGSIYVHLDWHVGHYAKVLMDEVFGSECFINEITWKRRSGILAQSKQYGAVTDCMLFYAKTKDYYFVPTLQKKGAEEYVEERFKYKDEKGRRYRLSPIVSPSYSPNLIYEYKGYKPPRTGWSASRETMERWEKEGKLVFPNDKEKRIQRKQYLDEWQGRPVQSLWDDIPPINPQALERLDYPTQKPEALLERIITASSKEGDIVLDCFCGSGTTAVVAEKKQRRWLACDLGRFSVHTARKRLLNIPEVRPFIVQNLGKYERQLWQTGQFAKDGPEKPEQAQARHHAYVKFILELYHATPITGYTWLHGSKGGRFVHVGGVDGPVTDGDVRQLAIEFKKAVGNGKNSPTTNGIDILGWDFAFEVNEVTKQYSEKANLQVKFKRIPRDVMDKRAVEQGDIRFFELSALNVKHKVKGNEATIELTDFVIPPDDVPDDIQGQVKHWSQWIDFWAIDWDNHGDTFHNEWQAFRTKKEKKLPMSTSHTYAGPGEYSVVVKVIDILGNDTTKTVKVKVK